MVVIELVKIWSFKGIQMDESTCQLIALLLLTMLLLHCFTKLIIFVFVSVCKVQTEIHLRFVLGKYANCNSADFSQILKRNKNGNYFKYEHQQR